MISLVVPTLDTLRQWLDDLGMNFFECDTCQALHLPHMQNFDGYSAAKHLIPICISFDTDKK
ncbi:histidine kinase [Salmonella enterica]|nr:histidine kinase [Salmonella enterica]